MLQQGKLHLISLVSSNYPFSLLFQKWSFIYLFFLFIKDNQVFRSHISHFRMSFIENGVYFYVQRISLFCESCGLFLGILFNIIALYVEVRYEILINVL